MVGERARRGRWPRMGHAPGMVGGSLGCLPLERLKKKKMKRGIRERSAIVRRDRGVWGESILVSVEFDGVASDVEYIYNLRVVCLKRDCLLEKLWSIYIMWSINNVYL